MPIRSYFFWNIFDIAIDKSCNLIIVLSDEKALWKSMCDSKILFVYGTIKEGIFIGSSENRFRVPLFKLSNLHGIHHIVVV
jgi:hypothetical protein